MASETGEFPDAESIHVRMVPICYEESIVSGAGFPCAEFMAIATETFVKQLLSAVFAQTRSNGPSGSINGMTTPRYRRQLEREELAYTRGEILRDNATGLLPVEAKEANARKPLGVGDLRLALGIGGGLLAHMPMIADEIMGCYFEEELGTDQRLAETEDRLSADANANHLTYADEMDLDDSRNELEGGSLADRDQLGSLLDDCLSMAS